MKPVALSGRANVEKVPSASSNQRGVYKIKRSQIIKPEVYDADVSQQVSAAKKENPSNGKFQPKLDERSLHFQSVEDTAGMQSPTKLSNLVNRINFERTE